MADPSPEERRALKRLDVALATRQFEIDLFWKRSVFFWGFIAAAFGALAWAYGRHPRLAVAISSFGLVCSAAWTLTNRGGRFWQVSWEAKVHEAEDDVIGSMFKTPIEKHSHLWWKGRRYSVSRLATSLRDYVVLLWSVLLAYQRRSWPSLKDLGGWGIG